MINKKYLIILVLILLIPIIILVGRSFALPINGEVKSINIQSNNYDEEGSFRLEKKVDWTEKGVAKITYNLRTIEMNNNNNYKDIVLVLDNSNLMNEGKLEKAKRDSMEFINTFLSDLHNRVALITFDSNATIKSNFTNNKEELSVSFGTVNMNGKSNYNNALLKVDELLRNYDKEDNKDLVVVLLTNGNPNEGVPNDKATYEMLKDKYPYININAIQYENTLTVSDGIKNISDYQILAGYDNVLDEAVLTSVLYDKFIINDVINSDYFIVNSTDDIKTNKGETTLTVDNNNQVISWSFNNLKSGSKAKMEVTINLKDEFKNQNGLFSTNKQIVIESKINNRDSNKSSINTLIMSNKYNLTYNLNKPSNCSIDPIASESYFVGDTVKKKVQSLYCDGYYVKNWLVRDEESDITYISDSEFLMPSHNVTVNAIWTKSSIVKSMDGVVYEKKNTLYRVLQDAAVDGTYAKEYKGPHQDSNTTVGNKKIYHWYADIGEDEKGTAITDMYHVKFANHCWRMIRTTDTGGVKLLYNGEYDETRKCGANRVHINYDTYDDVIDGYYPTNRYYADDYRYDEELGKYVLINPYHADISYENRADFIGKYTCRIENEAECESVYYIADEYIQINTDGTEGHSLLLISTSKPTEYASTYYASMISSSGYLTYNRPRPAIGSGYMYGESIQTQEIDRSRKISIADGRHQVLSADSIDRYLSYDYSTVYASDTITVVPNPYSDDDYDYYILDNPISVREMDDLHDLVGKYLSTYSDSPTGFLDYVIDVDDRYVYTIHFDEETKIYDKFYFGDSISRGEDGIYTIENPIEVTASELNTHSELYINKITCIEEGTSCEDPLRLTDISTANGFLNSIYFYYEDAEPQIMIAKGRNGLQLTDTLLVYKRDLINNSNNYLEYKYTCGNVSSVCTEDNLSIIKEYSSYDGLTAYKNDAYYGSDVSWDGTKYTLINPQPFDVLLSDEEISSHHFVCLGIRERSCEKVAYIISTDYWDEKYIAVLFENGKKDINELRKSMMENNIHDSYYKLVIDEWFHKNMVKYQDYLEDAVWCNDRKSLNEDGSWYKIDGNINSKYSLMADYAYIHDNPTHGLNYSYDFNYVLSLKCENETDRFSMDNPKAQLKYPVAMLTYNEMGLLYNKNAKVLPTSMNSLSVTSSGGMVIIMDSGSIRTSDGYSIVPAISLKYGTEYVSGDGSASNPYVVDTSEVDG